jgi:hypothetical protein
MTYDYTAKKITAIISDKLAPGMALNALGHLAFSAGRYASPEHMGKNPLVDADGVHHVGISRYPFIVLKGSEDEIKRIIRQAKEQKIFVVDYLQEMFDTGHDDELVSAVAHAQEPAAVYHAAILVGDSPTINALTRHLKLYR